MSDFSDDGSNLYTTPKGTFAKIKNPHTFTLHNRPSEPAAKNLSFPIYSMHNLLEDYMCVLIWSQYEWIHKGIFFQYETVIVVA